MIRFDNPHKMRISQPICEVSLKKWGGCKLWVMLKSAQIIIKQLLNNNFTKKIWTDKYQAKKQLES